MKRVRLGRGGEFDLIRRFLDEPGDAESAGGAASEVAIGPGDDAAVLRDGWVLSTDLSVEGVHFRRAWLTDEEIGRRAAAVALSDLAAMAATPVAILVSTAAPRGEADDLTKLSGLGSKLQEKLNAAGVFHFWQIAEWSDEEVAHMDEQVGGRISREDWVGQAKTLAAGTE